MFFNERLIYSRSCVIETPHTKPKQLTKAIPEKHPKIKIKPYFLSLYFLIQILTAATFCYLMYSQSLHNGASVNMFYQKR